MKNFEVRYPINGTSALQPKFDRPLSGVGAIIAFPGADARRGAPVAARTETGRLAGMRERVLDTEMARCLRRGSAKGCAYDRIAPWQAAVAGVVFAASALLVLLGS